jgi:hypothetical protein
MPLDVLSYCSNNCLLKRTSFMIKSTSLNEDGAAEPTVISTLSHELEYSTRNLLAVGDGRVALSALSALSPAASIDLVFIQATVLAQSLVVPFKVKLGEVEVLFDDIEPSLVLESDEVDANDNDKCLKLVKSYSAEEPARADTVELLIEASAATSIIVKVTEEESASLLANCEYCFGYTTKEVRCEHRRKILRNEKVWCYHHKKQEQENRKFQIYGDRPEFCSW